jgi:hypothetical protein
MASVALGTRVSTCNRTLLQSLFSSILIHDCSSCKYGQCAASGHWRPKEQQLLDERTRESRAQCLAQARVAILRGQ